MNPLPVGVHGDAAGGAVSATQMWFRLDGIPVLRLADPVAPHGENQHQNAIMVQASPWMKVSQVGVCRMGDQASCGHALQASRLWFRAA